MHDHDHEQRLARVRSTMPEDRELGGLAELFRIFGDATRMKILYALSETELCVCAIAELLGMTQPAISHQLKLLRRARLVGSRREGRTVYCFLADEHVHSIIKQGYEHLTEEKGEEEQ